MREFFTEILTSLKIYCGNDQVKNIRASHSKIEDAENEIRMLLDTLCNVSKIFSYIPDEEQKTIIRKCLISDTEYMNLNARLINRWLTENGKKYFKEVAHEETVVHEPAPPEVAEKYLNEFKANLEKIGNIDNPFKPEKVTELHESETLKSYYADKKKFIIEGIEVWAKTEDEAREIYLKNL